MGLVARLVQRQSPAQVLGGIVLVLVSALWAWRSGEASNFYATGLMINAAWLVACLVSLLVGWPIVGALMTLWHRVTDESGRRSDRSEDPDGDGEPKSTDDDPAVRPSSWRTDPALRGVKFRYHAGTWVLTLMFALRLVVEVPLYLAGEQAVSYLGAARLILGRASVRPDPVVHLVAGRPRPDRSGRGAYRPVVRAARVYVKMRGSSSRLDSPSRAVRKMSSSPRSKRSSRSGVMGR